jgi:hypothetical protein
MAVLLTYRHNRAGDIVAIEAGGEIVRREPGETMDQWELRALGIASDAIEAKRVKKAA